MRVSDAVTTFTPTVLVVMIGGNDSRESYRIGLPTLVRAANDARQSLVFVVVTVTHARSYVATDQNAWLLGTAIPELRAEGIDVELADTYSVMADHAEWFAPDGHMSAAGYAEAAAIIHEPLRRQVSPP